MLRKERVLEALRELCRERPTQSNVLRRSAGFSAKDVAEKVSIDRTNASRDLNLWYAEGQIERLAGRPVLFRIKENASLSASSVEKPPASTSRVSFGAALPRPVPPVSSSFHEERAKHQKVPSLSMQQGIVTRFETLIGSTEALKSVIQQAKAAMLYPPRGLHTLLQGPSGVGKTTLARLMHAFAVEQGALSEDAPFVSFNCADYAGNPQLLMAHLFGVVKGAYTGAEKDRVGLVEQAHRGVLFLDEVHRLPPEGQEMLFYLMDRELFRRMGEVEERKSSLLLLAATTEDPAVSLLPTFRRRIPMTILLPGLSERTIEERFELIRAFFTTECSSIGSSIQVAPHVLRAFLLYDSPGNVGQLRTDVQLSCARAYLEYRTSNLAEMHVHLGVVPDHVRQGLLRTPEMLRALDPVEHLLETAYVFTPTGFRLEPSLDSARDLYETISSDLLTFRQGGLPDSEISRLLHLDIQYYFQRFADEVSLRSDEPVLVDQDIAAVCAQVAQYAEEQLGRNLPGKFSLVLAMHLTSLMEHISLGRSFPAQETRSMRYTYPIEYEVARIVLSQLRSALDLALPESEVDVLTILLANAEVLLSTEQASVGIVVATHGRGVAAGLSELANTLVGVNTVRWIELSLEQSPDDLLTEVERVVSVVDQGGGVLLFVDFSSLLSLSDLLTRKLGERVRTIANVSAPLLIEAVRQARADRHQTLDQLVTSLIYFRMGEDKDLDDGLKGPTAGSPKPLAFPSPSPFPASPEPPTRIILSICLTGFGSALKIAELIEARLPGLYEQKVEILCMDVSISSKTEEEVQRMVDNRQVVAIIGTINPHISVYPFIPLTDFLFGDGLVRLRLLLGETLIDPAILNPSTEPIPALPSTVSSQRVITPSVSDPSFSESYMFAAVNTKQHIDAAHRDQLMQEIVHTLEQRMLFLNPSLVLPLILHTIELIEVEVGETFELDVLAGLMLHLACILERGVQQRGLLISENIRAQVEQLFARDLSICRHALQILSSRVARPLPDEEAYNIVGILRQVDIFAIEDKRRKA